MNLTTVIIAGYSKRKIKNIFICLLIFAAAFIALASLFYVLGYVIYKGLPSISLAFFTELPRPVGELGGGMANAVAGTAILIGLASTVGIPWGIFIGVFLSEYGRGRLGSIVRFSADLLTSVPSIITGLFVYVILVVPMRRFSALAGALALTFIMVPIVARSTEELLRLVPTHIREAGLALGLPRWKVILFIVLRGSIGSIMTGVVLSVARVAGETAPLLFTALGNQYWHQALDQPIASLPVQIYNYAISPFEEWVHMAWGAALVLVLFILVINIAIRMLLKPNRMGARD